jgi:hypothetical protein
MHPNLLRGPVALTLAFSPLTFASLRLIQVKQLASEVFLTD